MYLLAKDVEGMQPARDIGVEMEVNIDIDWEMLMDMIATSPPCKAPVAPAH